MIVPIIISSKCGEPDRQIRDSEIEISTFEDLQDSIRKGAFIVTDKNLIKKYLLHIPGTDFYDNKKANENFGSLIDYALKHRNISKSLLPSLSELKKETTNEFRPAKLVIINSKNAEDWNFGKGKRSNAIGEITLVKLGAVVGRPFKKHMEFDNFYIKKGRHVKIYLEKFRELFRWADYIDIYDRYAGSGIVQSGWPAYGKRPGLVNLLDSLDSLPDNRNAKTERNTKHRKIERIRFYVGYDNREHHRADEHMLPERILKVYQEIVLRYGKNFKDIELIMIPKWREFWDHKRFILFRNSFNEAKYVVSLDEGLTTFKTNTSGIIEENGEMGYKSFDEYDSKTRGTFKKVRINSRGLCPKYKLQVRGKICL